MKQGKRIYIGFLIALAVIRNLCAQEESLSVFGMAGSGGLGDKMLPAVASELCYQNSNFLSRGHLLMGSVGLGYAGIGYGITTRIGFFSLKALGSPFESEYSVPDEGRKTVLDMKAPVYSASLGYFLPLDRFSLNMAVKAEHRPWENSSPDITAPSDETAWDYRLTAQYRGGERSWSSNPLSGDAGWALSGGYSFVYRTGFTPWGAQDALYTHDDRPQQQVFLAAEAGIPVGPESAEALLRLSITRKKAFNAYERNRPRYGHPGSLSQAGVSGYVPESLPRDDAATASVSLEVPLRNAALLSLRLDWLRGFDGSGSDRKGAGLQLNVLAGSENRIDFTSGIALDPPSGTEFPFAGSFAWTRKMQLGERK